MFSDPRNPTISSANRSFRGQLSRPSSPDKKQKTNRRDRFKTRTKGRSASRNNENLQKLTRHHSAEQGREAPGEYRVTLFGLDIGPVTCRGVTVFVDSIFSITKTSISRTNSGICVKTLFLKCFLIPEIPLLVRLIEVLVVNYRVHLLRKNNNKQHTHRRDRFQ